MYQVVDFPYKIGIGAVEWLSGPLARNSGSTTAQDGTEQTFTGVGDTQSFRLRYTPKLKTLARRERGFTLSLLSGANACRVSFDGGDPLSPEEAGVDDITSQAWANGEPWANGKRWKSKDYPIISVGAAAAKGSNIIRLSNQYWGWMLGLGDVIGFFPSHFGMYNIIGVRGDGYYEIWPRLRKAITTADFATLNPVMIMKTTPEGYSLARGPSTTENQSVVLTEIIDEYVEEYFTDYPYTFSTDALTEEVGMAYNFATDTYVRDGVSISRAEAVDFNRATPASYFDADGIIRYVGNNELRIDHDPITGQAKGALIEVSRVNIIPYSEDFAGQWNQTNCLLLPNQIFGPDGSFSGTGLFENGNSSAQWCSLHVPVVAGTRYLYSLFAHAGLHEWFQMTGAGGIFPDCWANFRLAGEGEMGNAGPGIISRGIRRLRNGWYRCFVEVEAASTASSHAFMAGLTDNTDAAQRLPGYQSSAGGVFIFGANANVGSRLLSYIKSDGAEVTQFTDQLTVLLSAFQFNSNAGTIYVEYEDVDISAHLLNLKRAGGWGPRHQVVLNSTERMSYAVVDDDSVVQVAGLQVIEEPGQKTGRLAFSWIGVNYALAFNGTVATQVAGGKPPSGLVEMFLGRSSVNSNYINGYIKKVIAYRRRFNPVELQELTA